MATYKTLVLDVETIQGNSLAGATVYVSYDRTVRLSSGGIVPDPAGAGVAVPVTGTASVQVLASDDPDLATDSAGFGIKVRVVWTEAPTWRQQSKSYVAQVVSADASSVNLSGKIGAQPVPAQFVDMSTVLADASSAQSSAAASADSAAASAALVGAPADTAIATAVNGSGTATQTALDGRYTQPADITNAATTAYANLRTRMAKYGGLVSTENGCAADNTTDDTAALQALINASAATGGRVLLSPGVYRVSSLTVPAGAKINSLGGQMALFARPSGTISSWAYRGSTVIAPIASLTGPMVTVKDGGTEIEGVTFSGDGNTTGAFPLVLFQVPFEGRYKKLRAVGNTQGPGFTILGGQNTVFEDVHINLCGTTTRAALEVSSYNNAGARQPTNTLDFLRLTVEQSNGGPSIDVAWGTDTYAYAEFVRFIDLHCENGGPGTPGLGDGIKYSGPNIRVGSARGITFVDPFVFSVGGGVGLLQDGAISGSQPQTGATLQITGGTWLGTQPGSVYSDSTAIPTTPYMFECKTGMGFNMTGGEIAQTTTGGVKVDGTYGSTFDVECTATLNGIPAVVDNRTTQPPKIRPRSTTSSRAATNVSFSGTTETTIATCVVNQSSSSGTAQVSVQIDFQYSTANDVVVFRVYDPSGVKLGLDTVFQNGSAGRFPIVIHGPAGPTGNLSTSATYTLKALVNTGSGTHTATSGTFMTVSYSAN